MHRNQITTKHNKTCYMTIIHEIYCWSRLNSGLNLTTSWPVRPHVAVRSSRVFMILYAPDIVELVATRVSLSEAMQCYLLSNGPLQTNLNKIWITTQWNKCFWKCRPQNVPPLMCSKGSNRHLMCKGRIGLHIWKKLYMQKEALC